MLIPIFLTLGLMAMIIAIVHFRNKAAEKKRTGQMIGLAKKTGFTFKTALEQDILPDFEIFTKGYLRHARNVLGTGLNSVDWTIFDYMYTVGVAKRTHTYKQTFFWAETRKPWPKFILTREHLIHKLLAFAGYKDINFESNKKFSDNYYLRSPDQHIRDFFQAQLLKYFENNEILYNIESNGSDIIFYRLDYEIKPDELQQELERISQVIKLFGKK